ncbi:MAG: UDP-N-acetylglucosamine 2-epimerase [Candidatus Devosia symbiotica]|nr:UDP-N-acetylglucosamine 2-epimerase [Candidatus Devosia symbiotica]
MIQTIACITGGRADYGLLRVLLAQLNADPAFDLKIIATGQHLNDGGMTLQVIEQDGFAIAETVAILEDTDAAAATARATGRAIIGLTDALVRTKPDLVIVLGDRYEILAGTLAAHILRIPIAHLMGGDVTRGAIDDAFRHSITKLSNLHFVSTEDSARRVRQLGEDSANIYVVGSPGLDLIATLPILSRRDLLAELNLAASDHLLVVTFHPVTAEANSAQQMTELLAALGMLPTGTAFIFTGVNADTGGQSLQRQVIEFCAGRDNAIFRQSLGSRLYFSALSHCDIVVGNSSSGLYEAPSFKIPTVNIGSRQDGRIRAASVIDTIPEREAISQAIARALTLDLSDVVSPYGDGHSSARIVAVLREIGAFSALSSKSFVDQTPALPAKNGAVL